MEDFWAFVTNLVKKIPSASEADDQSHIGWEGFTRCPSTSSSSASDWDVANLDDLEAFDLPDEIHPSE